MRIPSTGETDLLLPLHEGMFEQPMWRTFLDRLRRAAKADHAVFILRPPGGDDTLLLHSGVDALADIARVILPAPGVMREGRVYALAELADGADPARRAAWEEFLRRPDLGHMWSVRVQEPQGLEAWLSLSRAQPMSAAHSALLTALVPHIRVMLRSFVAVERDRMRATIDADAASRMNFGWISIDEKCRIAGTNAPADRMLQRSGILYRGRYDRLTFASPQIDREVTAIARQFGTNRDARPRTIHLSRDPWLDMLVAPMPPNILGMGVRPVAIIYLNGDRQSSADRHQQLTELFGLTPSEARLAWSLAQGLTLEESADALGLTIATARNYSKKVFAKMGARRQAELVRHVLTSVLALS